VGLKVNRLIRLAYGPFALGTLPIGAAEEIGPRVLREQLDGLIPPASLPKGDKAQGLLMPKGKTPRARSDRPAARRAAADGDPPKKKEYKAGWAKPKKKASHPAKPGKSAPKPPPKPRGTDLTFRPPPAKPSSGRPASSERTGAARPRGGQPPKAARTPKGRERE
jgi:23S rRNA pseudouridine2605 synthase